MKFCRKFNKPSLSLLKLKQLPYNKIKPKKLKPHTKSNKIMEYLHEKLIVDISTFDQTDQGFEVNQNSVEYYEKILGIDLSAFKINNT